MLMERAAAPKAEECYGRIIRDGVHKTLAQWKCVIEELVRAIKQYRQSQDHQSVHALNKALERAEEQLTPDQSNANVLDDLSQERQRNV